jgi:hypothetical protein
LILSQKPVIPCRAKKGISYPSFPERTGSLATDGDLERIEDHFAFAFGEVVGAETLKIELYGFFEIGLSFFNGFSLAYHAQLDTMGDIPLYILDFSAASYTR